MQFAYFFSYRPYSALNALIQSMLIELYSSFSPSQLRISADPDRDDVLVVNGCDLVRDGVEELRGPGDGQFAISLGLAEVIRKDDLVFALVLGLNLK